MKPFMLHANFRGALPLTAWAISAAMVVLSGCQGVQPGSAVVDRQMQGQNKVTEQAVGSGGVGSSQASTVAPTGAAGYTVKKGDTLYSIALDHGVYYKDLQSWNNLEDPNRIRIGQQLRVSPPEGGAVSRPVQPGSAVAPGQTRPVVEERPLSPAVSAQNTASPTTAPAAAAGGRLITEPKVGKQAYTPETYARLSQQPVKGADKPTQSSTPPAASVASEPVKATSSATTATWTWPSSGKVLTGFSEGGNKGLDIAGNAGDPVKVVADGKVVYVGTGLRGYGQMVIVKHDATHLTAYAHNQKILVTEGQAVTQGQKIAEMGNTDADRVKLHFEVRKHGKPVDPVGYLPAK